jgi:hypothetical protein
MDFYNYSPGTCIICNRIFDNSSTTKIPIFDWKDNTLRFIDLDLSQYINATVHLDCWYLWEHRDIISNASIRYNFPKNNYNLKILKQNEYLLATGIENDNIDFAHGRILLPRSSMLLRDSEISSFLDVRGRTVNVLFLLKIIECGYLYPGNEIKQDTLKHEPNLLVKCLDYVEDYFLEVHLYSTKMSIGMNYDCFIFKDDIELIKSKL